MIYNILIEARPYNPATSSFVTVRMTTVDADASVTQLNALQWLPCMNGTPESTVSIGADGVSTGFESNGGEVGFVCGPQFGNEAWGTYQWEGATVSMFVGAEGAAWAAYRQVWSGTTGPIDRDGAQCSVELDSPNILLERNLLTGSYAGTGNAEGPVELKGTLKPFAVGDCQNVEPILIDPVNWIYQFHGYGEAQDVSAVYENAFALGPAISAASTFASLKAASLQPGEWIKAPAIGCFRLGAEPTGKITADVKGGKDGSTYPSKISTIVPLLIKAAGVASANIVQTSFAAFSTVSWCFYTKSQTTVKDAARQALSEAGGYLFADGAGKWRCGNYYGSSTPIALRDDRSVLPLVRGMVQTDTALPVSKVRVGYDRCWSTHTDGEISPALSEAQDDIIAAKEAADAAAQAAAAAQANATQALQQIDSIGADGILDRAEKAQIVREFQQITAERGGIDSRASAAGITTLRTNATNAYNDLSAYLNGLTPAYTDTSANTAIVRATWNSNWTAYYTARQALLNEIARLAADMVGNQPATTVANAVTNFNTRNDRNASPVPAPTIAADGTAQTNNINTDGSANITFKWTWGGVNDDIDGFRIVVRSATSSAAYTLGTTPAEEMEHYVAADRRSFQLLGVASNRYYTFYVQAYRDVDQDIAAGGRIASTAVKSTRTADNPYRPTSSVTFGGNVTGNVGGTPVATITGWAAIIAQAQADIDAAESAITAIQGSVSADFSSLNQEVDALQADVSTATGNISSLQSTTGNLNSSVSTLQSDVSAAKTSITNLQSSTSTLQSDVSAAKTNVSNLQTQASGIISSVNGLDTRITAQGGQISTINSTLSSQGSSISTLQTTVSNTSGDVATLKTQVNAGGGNLLVNTDLAVDASGWTQGANYTANFDRVVSGDQWVVTGENGLRIAQPNTTSGSTLYADWTQFVAVEAGKWYDVSARVAAHRCQAQIYLQWHDANNVAISAPTNGPVTTPNGGNLLGNWAQVNFKALAPTNAVRARFILRKHPTSTGTDSYAWFIRPQVAETLAGSASPLAYAPGSARSAIEVQATAISTVNTTVASLSTTVSTQGGSITTLQSSVSTLQGNVSTLQSTVSTQGSSISSLQTAMSTAQGDVATLKTQVNAGGGNLLVNTDLANASSAGWLFRSINNMLATGTVTGQPIEYQVSGENNFTIMQPNANGSPAYAEWYQTISIEGGKWYDVSGWYGAHRCNVQIYLQWVLDTGSTGSAPNTGALAPSVTGTTLASWSRYGFKAQAPANAVRANLLLRKHYTLAGNSDSWAWFIRPQVSETTATSASPLAYSPGSARASIVQQAQALSTTNSTLSTLSTTVGTQGGSITSLQSSFSNLNGTVSTLSNTVTAQGSSITSLQTAQSTAAGQIATMKTQVSAGAGNLLQNTDFSIGQQGWITYHNGQGGYDQGRNLLGDTWRPLNEHVYVLAQNDANTGYYSSFFTEQPIPVDPAKCYEWSGYVGAHRCSGNILVQFYNVNGTNTANHYGTGYSSLNYDGKLIAAYSRPYLKMKPPAGSAMARLVFEKGGTNAGNNSYLVICRPQMKEVFEDAVSPAAYSVGNAGAVIAQQATVLSTTNSTLSTLSSTVSSQGGSITSLQSSFSGLNGTVSTLSSTVSAQGSSISSLQSASSTQAGQISSLNSTVSTQGASISSNSQAITSINSSLSSLNTTVTASSNPNICPNGGFENGLRGWTQGGANAGNWVVNNWVWGYWAGCGGWTGGNNANNYAYLDCTPFGVAGDGNTLSQSFDLDFQGAANTRAYGEIVWRNSAGTVIAQTQTTQFGPRSFDVTGNGRIKHVHTAPAGASTAYARVVFYAPNGANISAMNVRQMKVEFGSTSTPFSGEATAGQMYQAYSDLNTSHASLSSTVSSQGGSISTLQSSFSNLNGTVSTLSSTVSTQGSSISSLQSASSSQSGQISTLQQQVRTGGGNLLNNTDFAVDTAGWSFATGNASVGDRIPSGDQWIVIGENGLRTVQPNAATSSQGDWTQDVAIEASKWYDVSVYASSHRANIQIYLQFINASGTVLATPDSGLIGPTGGGNTIADFVRRSFKGQAPAGTVKGRLYLRKFGSLTGTDSYAWFLRPQVAETTATSASPVAYSTGSARATIATQASALSTLTSQQASLSTTVSTQGGSITNLQNSLTTLSGSVSTLSSTVNTQGASISSLQTSTSTTAGNVATLTTQVQAGAGYNLIRNSGFENGLDGWSAAGPAWGHSKGNNWGSYAYAAISGTFNGYAYIDSPRFDADATGVFTASWDWDVWAANNGAWEVWSEILWFNSAGAEIGTRGYGPHATGNGSRGFWFGNGNGSNRKATVNTATAPANTVRALVRFISYSTQLGGFGVRQTKMERGNIATAYSADATIVQSFETISNLSGQYSSLSNTVGTLNSSVTTQQTAISNLQGRTSAFWQVTAVAGGRAQMTVYADANGGGGVDIVGDLRVHGNAMITGTINPEALSLGRFVKRINGSGGGSPNPGETRLLYAQDIGDTSANGSYLIELNGSMTTTVGGQTGSYNNRPFYTNHLPDGGLLLRLNKNGSTIYETYIQATELVTQTNVGNKIVSLYRNIVVDSPGGGDSSSGNATILIYAIRGGQDTGIVNGGDYYSQNVSANYHAFAVTAKTKWTFI